MSKKTTAPVTTPATSLPANVQQMIDAAFKGKEVPAPVAEEKFICPLCGNEYEYVLGGLREGMLWKKFVHESFRDADGILVATKFCQSKTPAKSAVDTAPTAQPEEVPVKKLVEDALERLNWERATASSRERLSRLFRHAKVKNYIALYVKEDEKFVPVGTATYSGWANGQAKLDISRLDEEQAVLYKVGDSVFPNCSDLFTIGNFVGYVLE